MRVSVLDLLTKATRRGAGPGQQARADVRPTSAGIAVVDQWLGRERAPFACTTAVDFLLDMDGERVSVRLDFLLVLLQ